LGDVARADIDALCIALDHRFQPFDIDLGTATLWHGGVAVIEPLTVPSALSALHSHLGALLDQVGIEREERPYRPHVTFARRAAGAVPPAHFPLHWHIDSFDLMASRDGLYESVQHYRAR
jgi:2'-5' RNA ligase